MKRQIAAWMCGMRGNGESIFLLRTAMVVLVGTASPAKASAMTTALIRSAAQRIKSIEADAVCKRLQQKHNARLACA